MPFHLSEKLLLGFLLAMNLLSFCLMGLDKRRAVKGQWRISERALLLFGFFGGSLGGLLECSCSVIRRSTANLQC